MAAENYHLKWDSHLSYLNSSVATLYKNEKFADVVLYSSSSINSSGGENGIPTVGISAHKFILSSCSQFFATMFETAPISSPNGVLYVVLPPDLSHRAIQILVQYMYSGEATVANDILSEVLRGGEILKIRGLCRTSASSATSHNHHHHQHHQRTVDAITVSNGGTHYGSGSARPPPLPPISLVQLPSTHHSSADIYSGGSKCPPGSTNCSTRYTIDHAQHQQLQQQQPPPPSTLQQQHQQFRGLGASVLPKDSPVIVKSPKISQLGLLPTSSKHHTNGGSGLSGGGSVLGGGISVNKEVAIDPEEKCCYQLNQLPVASSLCNEMGCSSGCPMSAEVEQQLRRRQRSQNDETVVALNVRPPVDQHSLEREYVERTRPPPDEHSRRDDIDMAGYEHRLRRNSGGSGNGSERIRDYFVSDQYDHSNAAPTKIKMQYTEQVNGSRLASTPPHPHSFLAIKQEPTDWTTTSGATDMTHTEHLADHHSKSPCQSPKQPLDFKMPLGGAAVKLEVGINPHSPTHTEQDERPPPPSMTSTLHDGNDYDARLACETCKQSFDEPKSWVQHLETHTTAIAPEQSTTLDLVRAATSSGGGSGNCNSSGSGSSSGSGNGTGNGSGNEGGSISNGGDTLIKTYVPKKRRRVSQQENSAGHVTLCCDLCSISFETPAEWVRHLNNEHTEIELAMFNSKKDSEQKSKLYAESQTSACSSSSSSNHNHTQHQHQTQSKRYTSRQTYEIATTTNTTTTATVTASGSGAEQTNSGATLAERCDICGKKFPTHNNMLTHKRSHNLLNGVSVSVSTSVSTSTIPTTDISVISTPHASSSEQLSTSPQA